jgi:hypothetical protein
MIWNKRTVVPTGQDTGTKEMVIKKISIILPAMFRFKN